MYFNIIALAKDDLMISVHGPEVDRSTATKAIAKIDGDLKKDRCGRGCGSLLITDKSAVLNISPLYLDHTVFILFPRTGSFRSLIPVTAGHCGCDSTFNKTTTNLTTNLTTKQSSMFINPSTLKK